MCRLVKPIHRKSQRAINSIYGQLSFDQHFQCFMVQGGLEILKDASLVIWKGDPEPSDHAESSPICAARDD
jgi:hypothetical protein